MSHILGLNFVHSVASLLPQLLCAAGLVFLDTITICLLHPSVDYPCFTSSIESAYLTLYARFNTSLNFRACLALIRVLMYLRTPDVGIRFTGKSLDIFGYSDADWEGDLDSRRSTTGYVVYAAGGQIEISPKSLCIP